jgi:aconitate decarboxylase
VFEAHKGFVKTFYPDHFDAERLLAYGKPYRVVDPGLAIKLFPSQYGTHYGITAGIELHRKLGGRKDIRRVRMVSPVMKYVNRPQPATGLDGKFSLQYTTSAALLDGTVKIASFTDERRFRADMVELLNKFELRQDETIKGDFHSMYVEVAVELADGSTHNTICRGPRGSWNSPMDESDHEENLRDCLNYGLPGAAGEQLIAQLNRLETLDAPAIKAVIGLMSGSRNHSGGRRGFEGNRFQETARHPLCTNTVDNCGPIPRLRLPEQPRTGIPGTVFAVQQPAPVRQIAPGRPQLGAAVETKRWPPAGINGKMMKNPE